MSKASPIQDNFNGGELSSLLYGRPGLDRYKTGLKTCLNFIPLVQGPVERRPGTVHIIEVKTSAKKTRVVRFEFSTTQAYILEFGDQYIRFIKDHAQIDDGSPVELATGYLEADLFQLKFAQSADILYITHPSYPPRKVTRTSDTAWTITNITFSDGPFLNTNVTTTTLLLSATTGSVTVTASAVTGINGGDGFLATDIGRLIRWQDAASDWTFLTITARADITHVTATIDGPDASAVTATIDWRLGVWSATTGYPTAVAFHQNRLVFAGPTDNPQRIDMSRTGDFENFAPTEVDGTVVDDNAVTDTLSADTVNNLFWIADDEKGLLTGTRGGEWITRPSDAGAVVTPSNVQSKRSTAYGSANIQATRAGRAMLFIQKAKRKLRELAYIFEDDGFRAPDLTLVAEHVSRTGIVEMAYQPEPSSLLWCVLTDGTLICLVYDRDQKVVGWSRHVVGGTSDAGTTQAKVESVAVIPNPDDTADELYVVVKRYIDGAVVRYIEYMKPHWEETNDQEDAFFVDSGLSLDAPLTIIGITQAKPAVVAITGVTFSDGDDIRITKVNGMTEVNKIAFIVGEKATNSFELFSNTKQPTTIAAVTKASPGSVNAPAHGLATNDEIGIFGAGGMTELNGNGFTVTVTDDDNFTIGVNTSGFTTFTSGGNIRKAIDSTAFTAYVSDGEARERTTTISGLAHLEGETVQVLAEGSAHPDRVVDSGAITLNRASSKVHVGLGYVSDFETLRSDAGAADGTAQGKFKRYHRVVVRFLQSLGGFLGPDEDSLDEIVFREGGDPMDTAVPLFTGDVEFEFDDEYTADDHVFYRQTQPLPVCIEAVMLQLHTQDR